MFPWTMASWRLSFVAWIAAALLACAGSDTPTQATSTNGENPPPGDTGAIVHILDPDHLTVTQPIEPGDIAQGATPKFVQVNVAEVTNPSGRTLTFEVSYQRPNQERTHLGDFTLYPSDRPGTFLVATQGKVASEGAIALTLTSPDGIRHGDSLRVGVRRMRFVEG
jgi:hypothetical protein